MDELMALSIDSSGTCREIGKMTVVDDGSDYWPQMTSEFKQCMRGNLVDRGVVVKGMFGKDECTQILNTVCELVNSQPFGAREDGPSWDWVERWIHLRRPQVRRTVHIPLGGIEDVEHVAKVGRLIVRLRNVLLDWTYDYGLNPVFGSMADITLSQYPRGGGFQIEHRDTALEGTACILALSRRGKDFIEGGLYARDDGGNIIDVESLAEPGDLMILRSDVRHGVAPVDPELAFDRSPLQGRWMLFAPLQIFAGGTQVLVS